MRPELAVEVEEAAPSAPVLLEKASPKAFAFSWELAALGAIVLASAGHLLIKVGLRSAVHTVNTAGVFARILHYLFEPAVVAGLGIYGIGTLLWIYAVSRRSISFLYPLTALTYAIVTMGGKFLFGESISPGRWLGIAVVMVGVALLQVSANKEEQR